MFDKVKTIDLHLPSGWNGMTVQELEKIAAVLIDEAKKISLLHPFNLLRTKVRLFLSLTGIEYVETVDPSLPIDKQEYRVRRKHSGRKEYFSISAAELTYWINERMKWLDSPSSRTLFPYPFLRRGWKRFKGPSDGMQNFSWRQYRIAGDYMSFFLLEQNRLLKMKEDGSGKDELKLQVQRVDMARSLFLSTIFNRKVKYVNRETRRKEKGFRYVSDQSVRNRKYFKNFPDVKFQVILFWWTGQMNELGKKFPRCFKKGNPKKQVIKNPLDLYTRTTATIEKYLGIDEKKMNNELFTIVLQHLEDMSRESEEMEKLRKK